MDPLQVLQRYLAFLRPHPHPSPFITLLRTTPEIDDPRLFNFGHGLESGVQGFEDLVLSFVHIAEVVHQLWKHELVGEDAALGYFDFLGEAGDGLVHLLDAGEDGVDLEGEAPPFGLLVVLLKHVDVLLVQILPLLDRLLYPVGLWDLFAQNLEESRLSASDVAFDCVEELSFWDRDVYCSSFFVLGWRGS